MSVAALEPELALLEQSDLEAARDRIRDGRSLAEDAAVLASDLRKFVRAAWPAVVPNRLIDTWHIDAVCDHLQAAYERDITRLVITVPPGTLKSTIVSVIAPAWRWASEPSERFVTASWSDRYAERDTRLSRLLIQSAWYRARYGDRFAMARDENLKTRYSNDVGGHRVATHVGGGTGERGDVLQLDDPHNAREAQSALQLGRARDWIGDTWSSRLNDSPDRAGVMIVIGQRIHEADVIGMLIDEPGRWTHLCLPARYERRHPFVTPERVELPSGRVLAGDPRTVEGELLAPAYQTQARLDELAKDMTAHVAAGQLQQRPAPREGAILRRSDWRWYPPRLSFYRRDGVFDLAAASELTDVARFTEIVHSWDTSLKDGPANDFVAGQVWGVRESDRYLLRLFKQRAGLNATIEAMSALGKWARDMWPHLPHRILIEQAANGPDAIAELKRRLDGVIAVVSRGDKELRAAAAAPALESGNCFLPGYPDAGLTGYDGRTPQEVQGFVESCAVFPNGAHDDDVDAWSQMVNWTRLHRPGKTNASVARRGRIPRVPGVPA